MKTRTAEELSDHIAADLIWRKKELTVLTKLLEGASLDREAVLLRSLVALLYAHWEGFIKNTGERYIDFIRWRRLSYGELQSNFVALGFRRRAAEAVNQRNLAEFTDLVEQLRGDLSDRSTFPKDSAVNTESNLTSTVLRDITATLGIDFAPFESKATLIDVRLVRIRNEVAHGQYTPIDPEAALELADEVQGMMEHFRNLVENAVELGQYRYSP